MSYIGRWQSGDSSRDHEPPLYVRRGRGACTLAKAPVSTTRSARPLALAHLLYRLRMA